MPYLLSLLLALFLSACSSHITYDSPMARGESGAAQQCVPYARELSGIPIYGDAHQWWHKANPFQKRKYPQKGAVLVLAKSSRLSRGHLAVVKQVLGPRQINVSHTNWGSDRATRRVVFDSHRVKDVSKQNDWSKVIFWNPQIDRWGLPYKVSGFVVP